jgi:ubiquinone/menaquinone biosynthesis C-methylase UbiE
MSADFTAIDYSAEMVAAFAQRFPGLRILQANAVDLGVFDDASLILVVFSCRGIDMVGHADRRRILHDARRVLAPGGAFIFSTHNRNSQLQDVAPDPLVYANEGSPISGDASTTRILHWMARAPDLTDC